MTEFANAAAYKFVSLAQLPELRETLRRRCRELDVKGTILLGTEGINLFVAGTLANVENLLHTLREKPEFADLEVKLSMSDQLPFNRMLVKIKREIIAFGIPEIDPAREPAPKICAQQLKQWLDERRPLTLLDVRNNYEIEVGTFDGALPADIDHFRQFPASVARLEVPKDLPVVMFCTGGIRCEKAAPFMQKQGYREVYHLDGGILKYFEKVGGSHYHGDCFVFDKRVAVDPCLEESPAAQCYACQAILSPADSQSPQYRHGEYCPHCYIDPQREFKQLLEQRQGQIQTVTCPLPGSVPYDNVRPLNVPERFDGFRLIEFLAALHPQIPRPQWHEIVAAHRIQLGHVPLTADSPVRAGQRLVHLIPHTVEPPVNPDIRVLFEDSALIVIDKPAPLPVHPSGRYNRNTLTYILDLVYQPTFPRPQHRLDANTTGIVVFTKTRRLASRLHAQFERHEVKKLYLAKILGLPPRNEFTIDCPISHAPVANGRRIGDDNGAPSVTVVQVLARHGDGTADLQVRPITGRTNQIRIHLWESGFPIVGDPVYGMTSQGDVCQTLKPGDPPMCLHHWRIEFRHPATNEWVCFETSRPEWLEPATLRSQSIDAALRDSATG